MNIEVGGGYLVERTIREVEGWQQHKGKDEYLRHLKGGRILTHKEAIIAKCYECNCGYDDGTGDCKIFTCPLQSFMPYREGGPLKTRVVSEEAKERGREQLKKLRERSTARDDGRL